MADLPVQVGGTFMEIGRPSEPYRFYQDILGDPSRNQYTVRGDTRYPGNYTVKGKMIVSIYNSSTHDRDSSELNRMGEINEAHHTGDSDRKDALIEDTRTRFQENSGPVISQMWDDVFAAYQT